MKEFMISSKIEDIFKKIKIPRGNKVYLIKDYENYERIIPSLYNRSIEERKSDVLYENFKKGINKLYKK